MNLENTCIITETQSNSQLTCIQLYDLLNKNITWKSKTLGSVLAENYFDIDDGDFQNSDIQNRFKNMC